MTTVGCATTPGHGGIVFLGTAPFAVPSLQALVQAGEPLALVVTQPDRPKGRGRKPVASVVKQEAERCRLPLYQPVDVNAPEALQRLQSLQPEFLVVVAYGQLLKRPLLELAATGVVNVHPSLLPRHRGPAPVAWSILTGDAQVGVSTMFLDEGMDAGPVLLQQAQPLPAGATRGEVEEELARVGADLLVQTLRGVRAGQIAPRPQEHRDATFSRLIRREDRVVAWDRPAGAVGRQVHALAPLPGAVSGLDGRLLKLLRVQVCDRDGVPGTVLPPAAEGPVVACGQGAVILLELQPEGRRAMSGAEFLRGGGISPGSVLEAPWDG